VYYRDLGGPVERRASNFPAQAARQTAPRCLAVAWAFVGCAALGTCAGCSGSATVSGNVSYNGSPVAYGAVSFAPVDDAKHAVVGTIDDGKYRVAGIAAGRNLVRVSVGERPAGQTGSSLGSAPSGTLVEIGKSECNIGGGTQSLNFKLNPRTR
jgi:hypothetical protein